MNVRSIEGVAPVVEHNGTVPVWWLVNPREMKDVTDGGFLELVSEFEVAGAGSSIPTRTRRTSSITSPPAAAS